jgi:hypothetical protein
MWLGGILAFTLVGYAVLRLIGHTSIDLWLKLIHGMADYQQKKTLANVAHIHEDHTVLLMPDGSYRVVGAKVVEQDPPKEEEKQQLALPMPQVPTGRETLLSGKVAQALAQGYYLLGPGDDGTWKKIACKKLFSTLIAGIPRVGKTTTVFWILTQVLLRGGRFFVIDPNMHYESEDGDRGLASELEDLSDFMIFPACEGTKQELLDRMRFIYRELQQRKQPGYIVKDSEAILAIMDEFNSVAQVLNSKTVVVVHEEEELNFAQTLALLEREGPKYGLCFMLIGHKWTKQDIGGDNAVRTNATTYLCHKMNDERQANLLLSGNGKQILELPVGAYLATGPQFESRATKIYTPMISARDIPVIREMLGTSRSCPDGGQMAARSCPISSTEEESGRDLDRPGQRSDMTNEEDELSSDLRTKMRLVLQMDQQTGTSVNKIIKDVWGVDADTRQGRAAKEELNTIRAYIAKRTLEALQ